MNRRGFTLVEVLVALFVIALGVGALLTTLMSSANAAQYLRDKSMAQWIAMNRVSETRLASSRPTTGDTTGTVEFANAVWRWQQHVSDAGISGLLRIDVQVARLGELGGVVAEVDSGPEGDDLSTLGRAIGFVGTALARPNGLTPEWSLRPPAPPGEGGPGGGGGGGGGDGDGDGP